MSVRPKPRYRDQVAVFLAFVFVAGFPMLPRPYKDIIGTVAAIVIFVGLLWICWMQAKKKTSR